MSSSEKPKRYEVAPHLGFLAYATAAVIRTEGVERYVQSQSAPSKPPERQLTPEEYAEQVRRFHDQKSVPPEMAEARRRYITPKTILPAGFSNEDTGEGIDVDPWAEH